MRNRQLPALFHFLTRLPAAVTPTDRELIERFARHGDAGAFADLVRRHGPRVLALCRAVLRHEQDAEDVFQATFLVLAKKAASTPWQAQISSRSPLSPETPTAPTMRRRRCGKKAWSRSR